MECLGNELFVDKFIGVTIGFAAVEESMCYEVGASMIITEGN